LEKAEIAKLTLRPTAKKRLGKYMLLGRIGSGGMGKIYLAYQPGPAGIEKLLVIKRLHSHLTGDSALVGNFLDEARLSMSLSHPNIVHTFDVGETGGRYFMVMEYIEGQNLGVLLRTAKRSGDYPESHIWAGMFLGVLDGLHAAHTAVDARGRPLNIIHRDISPQNVLITYDGMPKLVDFGIAKAAQRITETDAGILKGKYAYMSPEQCQSKPLDARSDVFAAGVVLWEMLAGRRLYKADSVVKSVERILKEEPFSPLRVNPDCDPGLADVALKALQKRRRDRWATAEEFRDALEDALAASGHRYRPSDTRALMGRLFEDVRARQREVLDRCLAGDLPEYEADSDHGTSSSSKSVGKLPLLNEETTPSTSAASPLITAEGDGESVRLPVDEDAPASAKTDVGLLAPTVNGRKDPRASDPETPPPPVVMAQPPPTVPDGGGKGGLIAAAVIALLLLGGLAAAFALDVFGDKSPDPIAKADPKLDGPMIVSPPKDDPGEGEGEAVVDTREDEVVVEETPPTPPSDPDENAENKKDERRVAKLDRRRRKPKKRRATTTAKVVEPPPTPEPTPEPKTPKIASTGKLWLDTVPWSTVYLGKKKLGNTPLVGIEVPAGELTLTLKNPQAGIEQGYYVKIGAGKKVRKRLVLE
jgi:serine/threonine-protein kinase